MPSAVVILGSSEISRFRPPNGTESAASLLAEKTANGNEATLLAQKNGEQSRSELEADARATVLEQQHASLGTDVDPRQHIDSRGGNRQVRPLRGVIEAQSIGVTGTEVAAVDSTGGLSRERNQRAKACSSYE